MKNLIAIIGLGIAVHSMSHAQSKIIFTYDVSGNQVERRYVDPSAKQLIINEDKETTVISDETTLSENALATLIKVYPNPTDGMLKLEWDSVISSSIEKITVTEASGRSWEQFLVNREQHFVEIDLRNNASGVYIIQFQLNNARKVTKRIIKK